MPPSSLSTITLVTLLTLTISVWLEVVSARGGYGGQHPVRLDTLYKGNDPVMQLHGSNYTDWISGKTHAWVVEFYATWCGHCKRFAPTWKTFAVDLKDWWPVIKVAAVACSHPDNAEICRRQEVITYPAVRFFSPLAELDHIGERYGGSESLTDMKHGVVDFVTSVWEDIAPDGWPTLTLMLNSDAVDDYVQGHPKRVVLFQDEIEDPYVGQEVILDLSAYQEDIDIRRASKEAGRNYGVTSFPSIYHSNADGSLTSLTEDPVNRRQIVDLLKQNMDMTQSTTPSNLPTDAESLATRIPGGAHVQDIESSLYISLWQEVAKYESISAEAMVALKTYIHVLATLLSVNAHVKNYMQALDNQLERSDTLSGEQWVKLLDDLQTSDRYIPKRVVWTGCEGSKPTLRGYTCGLWTTFHTLTVGVLNPSNVDISSLDVLLAIRGYVEYFFGCGECRQNFLQGSLWLRQEVTSDDSGVLWLWRKHNTVNHHLSGDATEDPRHPKVQFPLEKVCTACHHASDDQTDHEAINWNAGEVLNYMREFYGTVGLIQDQYPYNFTSQKVDGDKQPLPVSGTECSMAKIDIAILITVAQCIHFVYGYVLN